HLAGQIRAIVADVDARQHDLGAAGLDQATHARDHLARGHRAGWAAAIGNNAECAAVVAAVLHLHVGTRTRAHALHERVRRLAYRHDVVHANARRVAEVESVEGVRLHLLGIADDAIDLRHVGEALRLDLRRTSRNDKARGWVLAPELADGLAGLAHGLGGDRAGVDDHRILEPRCRRVAPHRLGFEGVEPAAQRDNAHALSGDLLGWRIAHVAVTRSPAPRARPRTLPQPAQSSAYGLRRSTRSQAARPAASPSLAAR